MVTTQELDKLEQEQKAVLAKQIPIARFGSGKNIIAERRNILLQQETARSNIENINQTRQALAAEAEAQRQQELRNKVLLQAQRVAQGKKGSILDTKEERDLFNQFAKEINLYGFRKSTSAIRQSDVDQASTLEGSKIIGFQENNTGSISYKINPKEVMSKIPEADKQRIQALLNKNIPQQPTQTERALEQSLVGNRDIQFTPVSNQQSVIVEAPFKDRVIQTFKETVPVTSKRDLIQAKENIKIRSSQVTEKAIDTAVKYYSNRDRLNPFNSENSYKILVKTGIIKPNSDSQREISLRTQREIMIQNINDKYGGRMLSPDEAEDYHQDSERILAVEREISDLQSKREANRSFVTDLAEAYATKRIPVRIQTGRGGEFGMGSPEFKTKISYQDIVNIPKEAVELVADKTVETLAPPAYKNNPYLKGTVRTATDLTAFTIPIFGEIYAASLIVDDSLIAFDRTQDPLKRIQAGTELAIVGTGTAIATGLKAERALAKERIVYREAKQAPDLRVVEKKISTSINEAGKQVDISTFFIEADTKARLGLKQSYSGSIKEFFMRPFFKIEDPYVRKIALGNARIVEIEKAGKGLSVAQVTSINGELVPELSSSASLSVSLPSKFTETSTGLKKRGFSKVTLSRLAGESDNIGSLQNVLNKPITKEDGILLKAIQEQFPQVLKNDAVVGRQNVRGFELAELGKDSFTLKKYGKRLRRSDVLSVSRTTLDIEKEVKINDFAKIVGEQEQLSAQAITDISLPKVRGRSRNVNVLKGNTRTILVEVETPISDAAAYRVDKPSLTKQKSKFQDFSFLIKEQQAELAKGLIKKTSGKVARSPRSISSINKELSNLPLSVGGLGKVASEFSGSGAYEKTSSSIVRSPKGISQPSRTRLDTNVRLETGQLPRVTQPLSNPTRSANNLRDIQKELQREINKEINKESNREANREINREINRQDQRQEQRQEQRLTQRQNPRDTPFPDLTINPNTSRNKSNRGRFSFRLGKYKLPISKSGFNVQEKRFGKFRTIAVNLPIGLAVRKGQKRTKETLGATFRLIPSGKQTDLPDVKVNIDRRVFREPFAKSKLNAPLTFIQKKGGKKEPTIKGARLASGSELREIALSRFNSRNKR